MARKEATQQQNSGRRRGETGSGSTRSRTPPARTDGLERALWIVVALSAATALVQLYIHSQLAATRGAYTSFCNVSSTVNCDAVLMSPYAVLLGIPMAVYSSFIYYNKDLFDEADLPYPPHAVGEKYDGKDWT